MEYNIKSIKYKDGAGNKKKRWDVYKGDIRVGIIYEPDLTAPKNFSKYGKYLVMLEKNFKSRYVSKYETALNHIKRETKNLISFSEAIKNFN